MPAGKLILIPTPLQEDLPLESIALALLQEDALKENVTLLVEEHKVARQRWLKWGLPREAIEKFKLLNEHTQEKATLDLISELKMGRTLYLMSDGGLPAFFDPGQELVNACHKHQITVTATPFPNSIALAIALSGFDHHEFLFAGFLPAQALERKRKLSDLSRTTSTLVLMDTPYRLQTILKEISDSPLKNRQIFLATNLNGKDERLVRGTLSDVKKQVGNLNKVEFVIVIQSSERIQSR